MKIETTKKEWKLLESFLVFSDFSSKTKYLKHGCICEVDMGDDLILEIECEFVKEAYVKTENLPKNIENV